MGLGVDVQHERLRLGVDVQQERLGLGVDVQQERLGLGVDVEHERLAKADANADRDDTDAATPTLQFAHAVQNQAWCRRSERVAVGDCAAMDIDALL